MHLQSLKNHVLIRILWLYGFFRNTTRGVKIQGCCGFEQAQDTPQARPKVLHSPKQLQRVLYRLIACSLGHSQTVQPMMQKKKLKRNVHSRSL
jgi:hypothetical protein